MGLKKKCRCLPPQHRFSLLAVLPDLHRLLISVSPAMNDEVLGALELDMAEKATPTHSPPVPAWRSFMSGCISGMAAVVVGQVSRKAGHRCRLIHSPLCHHPDLLQI